MKKKLVKKIMDLLMLGWKKKRKKCNIKSGDKNWHKRWLYLWNNLNIWKKIMNKNFQFKVRINFAFIEKSYKV